MNSPATTPELVRPPQRSFQAILIALSAALLVIFGMVLGRFVVTTQAVEVVDRFDAELTALRAELADLNRQLVQAESRSIRAQESADQYRKLANQQRIRADKLESWRLVLNQRIGNVLSDRQICLRELHQHVALDRSLPASDVLRFAEELFDAHVQTLQYVSSGADSPARPLPELPRLHLSDAAAGVEPTPVQIPRSPGRSVVTTSAPGGPPLPAPTAATTPSSAPAQRSGRMFFESPRHKPSQYLYFSARRSGSVVTLPRSSGITFLDTADADDGESVRR